jgi:hypothetical protein
MKLVRSVNSLQTLVIDDIDHTVSREDLVKRYYAVPKDYRPDEPYNPFESDPVDIPAVLRYGDKKKIEHLTFLCNMASQLYWQIIAEEAEQTYKDNK